MVACTISPETSPQCQMVSEKRGRSLGRFTCTDTLLLCVYTLYILWQKVGHHTCLRLRVHIGSGVEAAMVMPEIKNIKNAKAWFLLCCAALAWQYEILLPDHGMIRSSTMWSSCVCCNCCHCPTTAVQLPHCCCGIIPEGCSSHKNSSCQSSTCLSL